jgi:hypothetical protein
MRFPIRANSGTRFNDRREGERGRSPLCKEAVGAYRSVAEICHRRRGRNSHPASGFSKIASPDAAASHLQTMRASVPTPPGAARSAKFAVRNVRVKPPLHNVFVGFPLTMNDKSTISASDVAVGSIVQPNRPWKGLFVSA